LFFSQEQVLVHALAGLTTGTGTGLKFLDAFYNISIKISQNDVFILCRNFLIFKNNLYTRSGACAYPDAGSITGTATGLP
jgi:hypothetical protein